MAEVSIAIDNPTNGPIAWVPEGGRELRSLCLMHRFGPGCPPQKTGLPELPGHAIHLDVSKKKAWITDGAAGNDAKTKVAKESWKAAYRALPNPTELPFNELESEWVKPHATELDCNRWQYWMRRLVDDGKARVIKGHLPELKECKSALKGEIPCSSHGYTEDAFRTPDELLERRKKQAAAVTVP